MEGSQFEVPLDHNNELAEEQRVLGMSGSAMSHWAFASLTYLFLLEKAWMMSSFMCGR